MFGFLIPRNYTEALEFDKANNSSKWYDATKAELDSIHSYEVFQKHEKVKYDKQKKVTTVFFLTQHWARDIINLLIIDLEKQ